jgi:hypothetical protein
MFLAPIRLNLMSAAKAEKLRAKDQWLRANAQKPKAKNLFQNKKATGQGGSNSEFWF